ncbi:peroxidase [Marchantia polymorpha subsp. ruderalis]|uniref:Peroxidase n=2 Tax=Marchantia polymorpha TaxID=3197 RepID=A0A176WBV4_MARPO|nr:hypothetical protein AXG93_4877s1230 [Marchantia polymorpha subsp. ruderalis]PTQ41981.1 hypothetical protein MARPO_0032s0144 [Marchantia polymorpha]BBN11762.1 hypothetical protein Mp_5g14510 [Marchantia polymorpha subsp. ruderalis]|eukprot:PTQ41981.1 hypothetical protein MARPO_0032s0144 [Marchantia polymorpha]
MAMTGSKLIMSILIALAVVAAVDAQLSESFYAAKCPKGPAKVAEVIKSWVARDRTLAPALLRLHFHDCFVRGCDGSVLLDGPKSEKNAGGNKGSLRGFDVIDDVKAKVEALCPGVVSCSDILALAARDAIVAMGGTNWTVPLGRRDGVLSIQSEADADLPSPFASFAALSSSFAKKGLNTKDLVVLSGSHTVGLAQCAVMQTRLYNFSTTVKTDPALEPSFAAALKRQCKQGDLTKKIKMDQTKAVDSWDANYYSNVVRGKSLFTSDDQLKRNSASLKIVQQMNRAPSPFNTEFGAAMVKMGRIGVLTGTSGQIRKKCNVKN